MDAPTDRRDSPLKVRLVLDSANAAWIIGKFARRLEEHLPHWGVTAEISADPSSDADVNHWMVYHHPWVYYPDGLKNKRLGKSTMGITHVDDPLKLTMLKQALDEVVDIGICLSRQTVDTLTSRGVARSQLTFVTPGHDGRVKPRRYVIGMTTRLYPDGRKREAFLVKLASEMRLDAFHFAVFGSGWDHVIPVLEAAGATTAYHPGSDNPARDYEVIVDQIPTFDYYLYLGLDEGSMGTLDALAAGVPTIVPAHGFHLDVKNGITHPCQGLDDLKSIFAAVAAERQARMDGVQQTTWNEYARRHAVLWRALVAGRHDEVPALVESGGYATPPPAPKMADRMAASAAFYRQTSRSFFLPAMTRRFLSAIKKKIPS